MNPSPPPPICRAALPGAMWRSGRGSAVKAPPQSNRPNDDLLVSWKDIADYLKCSVRKAQRLETLELPVNRISGTKSVWASKSEIERWLKLQAEKTKDR